MLSSFVLEDDYGGSASDLGGCSNSSRQNTSGFPELDMLYSMYTCIIIVGSDCLPELGSLM